MPRPREAIKIRLPRPPDGPGSVQGPGQNTSDYYSSTRRRHPNYHTAFVHDVSLDYDRRLIKLHIWPVSSYSGACLDGFTSSVAYVESLPETRRPQHIPMPCLALDGIPTARTPPSFGLPLVVGGYLDRQPSWIFLDMQNVSVSRSTTVSATSSIPDHIYF